MKGKYQGLLDDIREKTKDGVPATEATPPSPAPVAPTPKMHTPVTERRKSGRPKGGKSSDPNFTQVTAYVEKAVHLAAQKELIDLKPYDFSDLVNDLLKKWVKSRT